MSFHFTVSALQLNMFRECPRKWGLSYLSNIKGPKSEAMLFGILVHECLEHLYSDPDSWAEEWPQEYTYKMRGEEARRAKAAAIASELRSVAGIVDPKPHELEPSLKFHQNGISYYVKPDFFRAGTELPGLEKCGSLVDFKTTSAEDAHSPWVLQDPSLWEGPMPEQILSFREMRPLKLLKNDIQANLYAHALMQLGELDEVKALWGYCSKKFKPGHSPKSWVAQHIFKKDAAAKFFAEVIEPTAKIMQEIKKNHLDKTLDSPLLLPHDIEACDGTGRFCDALAQCDFQESPLKLSQLKIPKKDS